MKLNHCLVEIKHSNVPASPRLKIEYSGFESFRPGSPGAALGPEE